LQDHSTIGIPLIHFLGKISFWDHFNFQTSNALLQQIKLVAIFGETEL